MHFVFHSASICLLTREFHQFTLKVIIIWSELNIVIILALKYIYFVSLFFIPKFESSLMTWWFSVVVWFDSFLFILCVVTYFWFCCYHEDSMKQFVVITDYFMLITIWLLWNTKSLHFYFPLWHFMFFLSQFTSFYIVYPYKLL